MGDACKLGLDISCELYVSVVAHNCLAGMLRVPTPVAGVLEACGVLPDISSYGPSDHLSFATRQVLS